jgi:hypothetical protein
MQGLVLMMSIGPWFRDVGMETAVNYILQKADDSMQFDFPLQESGHLEGISGAYLYETRT